MRRRILSDGPDSTQPGHNQFIETLYFRVAENGVLWPLSPEHRKAADVTVRLTLEYPTYDEELLIKNDATKYHQIYETLFVDHDKIDEQRVRRCLVAWDLDTLWSKQIHPLQRRGNALDDSSMAEWKQLPPLVRKAISQRIHDALGPA